MTTLSLDIPASIARYLDNTLYASTEVTPLSGGYSGGCVCRLRLRSPHEGRQTLVFKHVKSLVVGNISMNADRQVFEVKALEYAHRISEGKLVQAPKVHFFDPVANVVITDECGDCLPTLNQLVHKNAISPELGHSIGSALGAFLADLHTGLDEDVCSSLNQNVISKQFTAHLTHGRIRETLTGEDTLPALPGGVPSLADDDIAAACAGADEMIEAIKAPVHKAITHGDFWPGNVLVDVRDKQLYRMHVIDWEMSKTGPPGTDIGRMCAELYYFSFFYPSREELMREVTSALWKTYVAATRGRVGAQVRVHALRHAGAHFVALTPRIVPSWGSEENIRAIVLEGASLLSGRSNGSHWLEQRLTVDV